MKSRRRSTQETTSLFKIPRTKLMLLRLPNLFSERKMRTQRRKATKWKKRRKRRKMMMKGNKRHGRDSIVN
jgi:hypothetical protein